MARLWHAATNETKRPVAIQCCQLCSLCNVAFPFPPTGSVTQRSERSEVDSPSRQVFSWRSNEIGVERRAANVRPMVAELQLVALLQLNTSRCYVGIPHGGGIFSTLFCNYY
ncbi:hypothetical protein J6590_037217 [Homalodisca vitripennis]|nr:hypothetical protein J6590_037217 [Homalodisca vitripennis]